MPSKVNKYQQLMRLQKGGFDPVLKRLQISPVRGGQRSIIARNIFNKLRADTFVK